MSDKLQEQVEQVVEQILKTEEKVEKAMPTQLPANGGKDEIKSGTPLVEKQELMGEKKEEAKKAEAADEEKEEKDEEAKKAKMKKAEEKEDEKKEEKDEAKKAKLKKSIQELAEHLDEEELELIKAWREPQPQEEITKSQPEEQKPQAEDLKKALTEVIEPLKKALEEKDALIKGLSEKVEKMASQPAYDRRSISTLETLEKSGEQNTGTLSKSQVSTKMLELQLAGKGVTSHHIAEFEATSNISDPRVRELVFKELKLN